MKPQLLKVSLGPAQSFSVRHDSELHIEKKWHYHPEVELIHIKKGFGVHFVGDNISSFKAGDIVLIGSNLPHYWKFDRSCISTNGGKNPEVKVAHFSENFLGDNFLNLPENKCLRNLLEKSKRGIKIIDGDKALIANLINLMVKSEGADRILYLIKTLVEISKCTKVEVLSSLGFSNNIDTSEKDRIKDVYDYTFANFRNKINLEEIADVAKISPNSFCRFFKSKTQKTYSQFLNEIKVGQACKLLIDKNLNIKQVCYESGFNNFASFHKCFKSITGKSPLTYQKEYLIV